MLSKAEQRVFDIFREYLMTPGKMLCFSGPSLERDRPALQLLTEKKLLVKEKFKGGYSLTSSGFVAMRESERRTDAAT